MRGALIWTCGVLASGNVAHAEDESPATQSPPAAALEHYSRGRAHYQAGRYQDAVEELERALKLDPQSPNLVYNLARVYELLGEFDRALVFYERYRDMLPSSEREEQARVNTTIQRLQGAKLELSAPGPKLPPVHPPGDTTRSERGVADGAFWTVASLSLAAFAVGGVSGALALRSEHDARSFVLGRDGDVDDLAHEQDRADRRAVISDVGLATGAVGGLTSILLYALRTRTVVEPQLAVTPAGIVMGVRGAL